MNMRCEKPRSVLVKSTAVLSFLLPAIAILACDGDSGYFSPDRSGGGNGDGGDAAAPGVDFKSDFRREAARGTDGIQGCNPKSFTLQQAPPPDVYLVLDRSGSMADQGSTSSTTKWQELYSAVDYALKQFDSTIRFGLLMYPSDTVCKTSGPQLTMALNNRLGVLYHLKKATPAGGTPTAAALNNAADSIKDVGNSKAAKYLILATDGGPNCNYFLSTSPSCTCTYASANYCCTSYPTSCLMGHFCLDETNTLAVIKNLASSGIKTFVIGLAGSSQYKSLLNAMAKAGGAPQVGGATDYYSATSQTEIQAALKSVAVAVISCEISLDKAPEYPSWVHVYLDGKEVSRDPTKKNGWDYTDSKLLKIKLYGTPCTSLQDGAKHTLTATFACVPS